MKLHSKPFFDHGHQVCCSHRGVVGLDLAHKGQNFRCELVALFGAALLWDQTGQPAYLEGGLSLVEGGTGEAERGSGVADGAPLPADTAQHLVLDLNQIAGVEEFPLSEQFVADLLRLRVECTCLAKRLNLGIGMGCFGHELL
jgi:hypothetical protein